MTFDINAIELSNSAIICVAWLLALPLGIALTARLAGVENNLRNNIGSPRH